MRLNIILLLWMFSMSTPRIWAGNTIEMTLEKAVEIAITNSYRVKMLEMEINASLQRLEAYKAGLKTQVYMNLQSPDLQNVSEYKWNSNLYRDEIVRQNTLLWQSDLAVEQPLILFGYPTNGSLSLNYKVYRYLQRDDGERDIDYYNRLYLKFEQPFFLPNEMKNDLERAELRVKTIQYNYITERVQLIRSLAEDYFDLFEKVYMSDVQQNELTFAKQIHDIAEQRMYAENIPQAELQQVELELANIQEKLYSSQSRIRRKLQNMRQLLRLSPQDSVNIDQTLIIRPIDVNLEQAIQLGMNNNPSLKRLHIYRRQSEIDIENEKGNNAFHMSLEMTYGLEKKDDRIRELWHSHDNSNSATINAYLPVWDGGKRKRRIQAEVLDLRRRELQIVREKEDIEQDIISAYTNVKEFYQRLLNMQKSRLLAEDLMRTNIQQYSDGELPLTSLLQMLNRYDDTEESFIEIYLSYRDAVRELMTETYYDFENGESLLDQLDNARLHANR